MGEDGLLGLSDASRKALGRAEVVFGGARHLALADIGGRGQPWPTPFDATCVLACRGRPTAVLASGDPFWFGVGSVLAERLTRDEWIAYPSPSTFSLAVSRLGWPLEAAVCLGLHAAPFERLLPHLANGTRIICLLRDGAAANELAQWLTARGWGSSRFWALTALGGPRESISLHQANDYTGDSDVRLIAVAIEARGSGGLSRSSGLSDELFLHEGQITKRPMRALALSALAPKPGEQLWDIGAGSGSVAIEWALCGGFAVAVEARGDRAANIRKNVEAFGLTHGVTVMEGTAPGILSDLEPPQAVFVGGGFDAAMFAWLWLRLAEGARLVVDAVTLETQALLMALHQSHAGDLMRIDIAHAAPLGRYRSWEPARPIVQWSVVKGGNE